MDGLRPSDWDLDALLVDGTLVHVRPITPQDGERLVAFHSRLSVRTTTMRYFTPHPSLSEHEIERFTTVDYRDRVAFIALRGDDMLGVARYDRLHDGDEAEVAFTVEDAFQGRGVGMLLLELLAAAAYELGIRRFVAETLPENRRMLRVFADAGFDVTTTFENGLVHVEFPTKPTDRSWEAMSVRERTAEARSMELLLRPRSVAVVGASRDPASLGHVVFRNLLAAEFTGTVYPVNPAAASVAGVRAYPSLLDIRDTVDLVVVAVPASEVPVVVDHAAEVGARGLVVLSAGFADVDDAEGRERQRQLHEQARASGMRVVGPNSMGVANTDPEVALNATTSDAPPPHGRVGVLSQSGVLGIALLQRVRLLGLGVSTFVSVGNKADVSGNDLLQYWETDARTNIAVLYLESFGNPRKFARIARRMSRSKPIVVVKSGQSGAGQSGNGATAPEAPDAALDALFRQAGVIRVDTLRELFDVVAVLAHQPLPQGNRVAIVGNSGGAVNVAGDAAVGAGLRISARRDLHGRASAADYEAALRASLADPEIDSVLVLYAPAAGATPTQSAEVVARVARGADKPVVPTFLGMEMRMAELRELTDVMPVFPFPEPAVHALAQVSCYAAWRGRPEGKVPELPEVDPERARACLPPSDGSVDLSSDEAVALLRCFGIPVSLGAPLDGVPTVVEVVQDPSFGSIVRFGVAGVTTELLGDVAFRILPLTDVDAAELVRAPKAAPLLFGHDNMPPVDVAALEDLLLRVGRLADEVPEVAELSLTPVVVGPTGVVAAGARIRLAPAQHLPGPLLRTLR